MGKSIFKLYFLSQGILRITGVKGNNFVIQKSINSVQWPIIIFAVK